MEDVEQSKSYCNGNGLDHAVEIERLAVLEALDYEVARKAAADRLGLRAAVLDDLRAQKRRELKLDTAKSDDGQGRTVQIEDILPWADAIEGDHVASALAATLKRFLVLSDASADAIALWVLHTWLVDKFTISPRLAITSPTKGCGKTTVLRFLNQVVRRPKRAGSISPPALFRAVERFQPTLILDETEKYIEHGGDLHALVNEGHCKGATVMRVEGDKEKNLVEFSVFAAVAFAANGRLPDDLEQRSIVVEMQRRLADENVDELREDRTEQLRNLARMCARWADDVAELARDHDPDMGGLINRVADNWRPIFAISDLIGQDWPARARNAAAALLPIGDGDSIGPMLLADIRVAFDEKSVDRLSSAELCEALNGMEGRPWGDWKGKSLTPNQLARLLKPFSVAAENIRVGGKVPKGYQRHRFGEAWARYLGQVSIHPPTHTPYEPLQRYNADEMGTSCTFQSATETPNVAVQKCEKPPSNGHCSTVAVQKAENGGYGESEATCDHCGQPGDLFPAAFGDAEAMLHPGCQEAWVAAQDDLTIPTFLDRRVMA